MWKSSLLVATIYVAVVLSDFCKTVNNGYNWASSLSDGAKDFAYTGVALNDSYYCFEGCLNTAMVVQQYKVKLASASARRVVRQLTYAEMVERFKSPMKPDDNTATCMDTVLRQDVNNALQKVTNHSAKAIARTIQYEINRPGWCINVVELEGGLNTANYFEDMNFCQYTSYVGEYFYDIRLAAVDFSL